MQIIEQTVVAKNPKKASEDGILVTDDFVAVIDGSTSKTDRRYSLFSSNGRLAMKLVADTLRHAPKTVSMQQFCVEATRALRRKYRKSDLPRLTDHPEERLAASAVIFSRLRREIWMIGDCQCLINGQLYENPKPSEAILARMRADEVKRLLANGHTVDELLSDDIARPTIIPAMLEYMREGQNKTYAVIDGFDIPLNSVRQITLTFEPFELVLASDGYPTLHSSLAESEAALAHQLETDPLNVGTFQATKACMKGNNSFDDRAYIRFIV